MDFKELIELSNFDIILLTGCPIASVIGSYANTLILEMNLSEMPVTKKNGKVLVHIRSFLESTFLLKWLFARLLVGAILGLVLALYFVGIIKEDINSIARILAFAILIGYAAPKLWVSQDRALKKYVDKSLKKITNENIDEV